MSVRFNPLQKTAMFGPFAALALVALTACGGSSSTSIPPTPNASSTTITVTVAGVPTAGITVTLSTALNGAKPSGTIIATGATNAQGQAAFNNLPSSGTICDSAEMSSSHGAQFVGACHRPFPSSDTLAF